MLRIMVVLMGLAGIVGEAGAADLSGCSFNGQPLYGRVEIVSGYADFLVQEVSSRGDLRVKFVNGYGGSCGEWEIVESSPDFTVALTSSYGDFSIEIVSGSPGLN